MLLDRTSSAFNGFVLVPRLPLLLVSASSWVWINWLGPKEKTLPLETPASGLVSEIVVEPWEFWMTAP